MVTALASPYKDTITKYVALLINVTYMDFISISSCFPLVNVFLRFFFYFVILLQQALKPIDHDRVLPAVYFLHFILLNSYLQYFCQFMLAMFCYEFCIFVIVYSFALFQGMNTVVPVL